MHRTSLIIIVSCMAAVSADARNIIPLNESFLQPTIDGARGCSHVQVHPTKQRSHRSRHHDRRQYRE